MNVNSSKKTFKRRLNVERIQRNGEVIQFCCTKIRCNQEITAMKRNILAKKTERRGDIESI